MTAPTFLLQDAQAVPIGVPAVKYHRKGQVSGQPEVLPEDLLLQLPGGLALEVVQARLADDHHPVARPGKPGQLLEGLVGDSLADLMWVDAYAGIYVGVRLGYADCGPGGLEGAADGDDPAHPRVPGPLNYGRKVGAVVLEVGVAVGEVHCHFRNL